MSPERFRESLVPREPERLRAPEPAAPLPVALTAAHVIKVQRQAGNQAVRRLLQDRDGARLARCKDKQGGGTATVPKAGDEGTPDPRRVAAEKPTVASIMSGRFAVFRDFARRQVDWRSQPNFQAVPLQSQALRKLLDLAPAGEEDSAFAAACGGMPVGELVQYVMSDEEALTAYAAAVGKKRMTIEIERVDRVLLAVFMGRALIKLEHTVHRLVLRRVFKQGTQGRSLSSLAVTPGAVDAFISYVQTCKPLLMADNGAEISSFLTLFGKQCRPEAYKDSIPYVRNLHRFSKAALEALQTNFADTSKSKPLVIVLQTAIDDNGAFHHDQHMTDVITNKSNLTLVIEGPTSLGQAAGQVKSLASIYGQGGQVQQLMLAGHGEWRAIGVAGEPKPDSAFPQEHGVNLDTASAVAMGFLKMLVGTMATNPQARLVLNACLTSSTDFSDIDADQPPERLKAAIEERIKTRPSLAKTVRDIAEQRGIKPDQIAAANASFGEEADLIDPGSGQLGLISKQDPALTSPDRFAYVRAAADPIGAMRAVIECVVTDPKQAAQALDERLSKPPADWSGHVVVALYTVVRRDLADLATMVKLSQIAGALDKLSSPVKCRVDAIEDVPPALQPDLFGHLAKTETWQRLPRIPLVCAQVWMRSDPGKRALFLDALAGFTCGEALPYLELPVTESMAQFLASGAGNPAGQLRLALLEAGRRRAQASPACISFLRTVRGATAEFPDMAAIDATLGGMTTAARILASIREPDGTLTVPSAAPVPKYNIDLDGDGINDAYLKPPSAPTAFTLEEAKVRAAPNASSDVVGTLNADVEFKPIGEVDGYLALEFGASTWSATSARTRCSSTSVRRRRAPRRRCPAPHARRAVACRRR